MMVMKTIENGKSSTDHSLKSFHFLYRIRRVFQDFHLLNYTENCSFVKELALWDLINLN